MYTYVFEKGRMGFVLSAKEILMRRDCPVTYGVTLPSSYYSVQGLRGIASRFLIKIHVLTFQVIIYETQKLNIILEQ